MDNSINVRPEFSQNFPVYSNGSNAYAESVQQRRPTTSNISSGVPSGVMIYDFTTGSQEWCDLARTFQTCKMTTDATTPVFSVINPLPCMFSRAILYIQGRQVSTSNNYSQDNVMSKRIMFGAGYNKSINDMPELFVTTPLATNIAASTTYRLTDFFDALFLRTADLIIPPNCNVRIELTIDNNYLLKMKETDSVNTVNALTFTDFYINTTSVISDRPVPAEYELKIVSPNSFLSLQSGTTLSKQYTISPNAIKVSLAHLSTNYITSSATKKFSATRLDYDTDTSTDALNTMQFKLGNQVMPLAPFDNTAGFKDSYLQFINACGHTFNGGAGESLGEWEFAGPLYVCNIVKSNNDKSSNLEVIGSYAASPDTNVIVCAWEENVVLFNYDPKSSALLGVTTLQ